MRTKWKLTDGDVDQILKLYQGGFKKSVIARKFNVDHSTVFYHIVKNTDKMMMTVGAIGFRKPIRSRDVYIHQDFDGDIINQGKASYREYLTEDRRRTLERQKECIHTRPENYRCARCGKQLAYPVKLLADCSLED